ncbi:MAG: hypothetical protein R6V32_08225 [Bacteroidales bacterium]
MRNGGQECGELAPMAAEGTTNLPRSGSNINSFLYHRKPFWHACLPVLVAGKRAKST